MKGWVYIITNRAMPDLVKVGFSTKDPELRAAELNNTGSPHPYTVEYEILVDNPHAVEQKAHKLLKHRHDGKEWFRCDAEEAILAIKQSAGVGLILENFKGSDREKVRLIEQSRAAESARHDMESIRAEYQAKLDAVLDKPKLWVYWLVAFLMSSMIFSAFMDKSNEWAGLICLVAATMIAPRARRYHRDWKKKAAPYTTIEGQMNELLSAASLKSSDLKQL